MLIEDFSILLNAKDIVKGRCIQPKMYDSIDWIPSTQEEIQSAASREKHNKGTCISRSAKFEKKM